MAKKLKKVSLKLFPHKSVKPISVEDDKELRPLYGRIGFNTRSTNFPFLYDLSKAQQLYGTDNGAYYIIKRPDINSGIVQIPDHVVEKMLFESKEYFEKIIRYESDLVGIDKYSLKGLYDRSLKFRTSILKVLDRVVAEAILSDLGG